LETQFLERFLGKPRMRIMIRDAIVRVRARKEKTKRKMRAMLD
jgi:hypothetical protein